MWNVLWIPYRVLLLLFFFFFSISRKMVWFCLFSDNYEAKKEELQRIASHHTDILYIWNMCAIFIGILKMKHKNQNGVENVMRWKDNHTLLSIAFSLSLCQFFRSKPTEQTIYKSNACLHQMHTSQMKGTLSKNFSPHMNVCNTKNLIHTNWLFLFHSNSNILICTIFYVNGVETKKSAANKVHTHTHKRTHYRKQMKENTNMKWQWRRNKRRSSSKTLSRNELFMGIKITERACSDLTLVRSEVGVLK